MCITSNVTCAFKEVSSTEIGDASIILRISHCIKSVQLQSLFLSVFCRIWTAYGEIRNVFSPNAGKYGTEKTPYFGTFDAVS